MKTTVNPLRIEKLSTRK